MSIEMKEVARMVGLLLHAAGATALAEQQLEAERKRENDLMRELFNYIETNADNVILPPPSEAAKADPEESKRHSCVDCVHWTATDRITGAGRCSRHSTARGDYEPVCKSFLPGVKGE